jgi:hypothetical protein
VAVFTLEGADTLPPPAVDPNDFQSDFPPARRLPPEKQRERNKADENWSVKVPIKAGEHEVTVTFLGKSGALTTEVRERFLRPFPRGLNIPEGRSGSYVRYVEISGPFDPSGPGRTASRERIFRCRPRRGVPGADGRSGGVREGNPDGSRTPAYRRPVEEADVAPLLGFYRKGHEEKATSTRVCRRL